MRTIAAISFSTRHGSHTRSLPFVPFLELTELDGRFFTPLRYNSKVVKIFLALFVLSAKDHRDPVSVLVDDGVFSWYTHMFLSLGAGTINLRLLSPGGEESSPALFTISMEAGSGDGQDDPGRNCPRGSHARDPCMSQDCVGVMDDVVVVAGDIGKTGDGQSNIVCVENHRDVIAVRDIPVESRGDLRVISGPPVPCTTTFHTLLPPDNLTFKGSQRTQQDLIGLSTWIVCSNCPDIGKYLADTVILIADDAIKSPASLQLVDHMSESTHDVFSDSPDLSRVCITQPEAFTLDGEAGVVGLRIFERPNSSPAPVIGRVKDVADDDV